jgi:hypothetical protein
MNLDRIVKEVLHQRAGSACAHDHPATKHDLDATLRRIKAELIAWIVGTVGLSTLINHYWR